MQRNVVGLNLLKAMSRSGLVQVQRTVHRKGTTFTQMYWVLPNQVKATDVVIRKQPVGNNNIHINSTDVKPKDSTKLGAPTAKRASQSSKDKMKAFASQFATHDDLYDALRKMGIPWLENAKHEGINYMRAKEAVSLHYEDGVDVGAHWDKVKQAPQSKGTSNTTDKVPTKANDTPNPRTDKTNDTQPTKKSNDKSKATDTKTLPVQAASPKDAPEFKGTKFTYQPTDEELTDIHHQIAKIGDSIKGNLTSQSKLQNCKDAVKGVSFVEPKVNYINKSNVKITYQVKTGAGTDVGNLEHILGQFNASGKLSSLQTSPTISFSVIQDWHDTQYSELARKQADKSQADTEAKRNAMTVITGLNVPQFDSEADYMPALPPDDVEEPDYTIGVTQSTKTDREKEKFGDILKSATPHQLHDWRTLGMCAGDTAGAEYLADLYNRYVIGVTGRVMELRTAQDKLSNIVNRSVTGIIQSSLTNVVNKASTANVVNNLLTPWVNPNMPLSDRERASFIGLGYTTKPQALRAACIEKDGKLNMLRTRLDQLKRHPAYKDIATEYDQIVSQIVDQSGGDINLVASTTSSAKSKLNTLNKQKQQLTERFQEYTKNGWSGAVDVKRDIEKVNKDIETMTKVISDPSLSSKLKKITELKKKLTDPKFKYINANLYHTKAVASEIASQYVQPDNSKNFLEHYPILAPADLDKASDTSTDWEDLGKQNTIIQLALAAGQFKPSANKNGQDAGERLKSMWDERKGLIDAYGKPVSVEGAQVYTEDNEVKCKVTAVDTAKRKEIEDLVEELWDKKNHAYLKGYTIKGVYKVEDMPVEERFQEIVKNNAKYANVTSIGVKGGPMGAKNCQLDQFFHGTGAMATALICGHSGQFKIVDAKVGSMLGRAIYLADCPSKSAQYIRDLGFGGKGSTGTLFICDASLGDVYTAKEATRERESNDGHGNWSKHDTVFGGKKEYDLRNNEWATHNPEAVIPRYIIDIEIH